MNSKVLKAVLFVRDVIFYTSGTLLIIIALATFMHSQMSSSSRVIPTQSESQLIPTELASVSDEVHNGTDPILQQQVDLNTTAVSVKLDPTDDVCLCGQDQSPLDFLNTTNVTNEEFLSNSDVPKHKSLSAVNNHTKVSSRLQPRHAAGQPHPVCNNHTNVTSQVDLNSTPSGSILQGYYADMEVSHWPSILGLSLIICFIWSQNNKNKTEQQARRDRCAADMKRLEYVVDRELHANTMLLRKYRFYSVCDYM